MTKKYLTADEIVYIHDHVNKEPVDEIALKLGKNANTIYTGIRIISNLLTGSHSKIKHRTYMRALKIIRERENSQQQTVDITEMAEKRFVEDVFNTQYGDGNSPQPKTESTEDRFTRLEEAFNVFQSEVAKFAESQAEEIAQEKIAELKKKYEEELAHMQSLLVAAKESNVAGYLRRHFGK